MHVSVGKLVNLKMSVWNLNIPALSHGAYKECEGHISYLNILIASNMYAASTLNKSVSHS